MTAIYRPLGSVLSFPIEYRNALGQLADPDDTGTVTLYADEAAQGTPGQGVTIRQVATGLYFADADSGTSGMGAFFTEGATIRASIADVEIGGETGFGGFLPGAYVIGTAPGSSGSGSELVTITVVDEDENPIENLPLRLFDSSGNLSAQGTSDVDGDPGIESLNSATYTPSGHVSGVWQIVPGQTLVVTEGGPNEFNVVFQAVGGSLPPHTDPEKSIGYFTTYDNEGVREGSVEVTAKLKTFPDGSDGCIFDDEGWTVTSDENGDGQFGSNDDDTGLLRGAVYRISRGGSRWWDVTVPDAGSFYLDPLAGSP